MTTALWCEFLNSDWHDALGRGRDADRLEDPGWLRQFAGKWGMDGIDPQDSSQRRSLEDLRSLLQRFVAAAVKGLDPDDRDLARLNGYLGVGPVRSRIERIGGSFRMRLEPEIEGIEAAVFSIASSFAEFLVEGGPGRLKTCANPDCGWVFYDSTRSRTRRWCDESCGNLMKVRKFRERRKGGRGRDPRDSSG